VLAPKLGQLARDYPDIVLDITTDDSLRDIVAEGFDAGIYFREYIENPPAYTGGSSKRQKVPLDRGQRTLIVDGLELVIHAALEGVGLAYMAEENAATYIARGDSISARVSVVKQH
jgi:DNA-binding transcriptional LysR family regulator